MCLLSAPNNKRSANCKLLWGTLPLAHGCVADPSYGASCTVEHHAAVVLFERHSDAAGCSAVASGGEQVAGVVEALLHERLKAFCVLVQGHVQRMPEGRRGHITLFLVSPDVEAAAAKDRWGSLRMPDIAASAGMHGVP